MGLVRFLLRDRAFLREHDALPPDALLIVAVPEAHPICTNERFTFMTPKILKNPKMAWLRNRMQILLVKGPDFCDTLTSFEYET